MGNAGVFVSESVKVRLPGKKPIGKWKMRERKRKFVHKSSVFVENRRKKRMRNGAETIKNTQLAIPAGKKYVKYLLNLCPFYRKKL